MDKYCIYLYMIIIGSLWTRTVESSNGLNKTRTNIHSRWAISYRLYGIELCRTRFSQMTMETHVGLNKLDLEKIK